MELQLWAEGADPLEELEDLNDWLSQEPELRGRVKPAPAIPSEGELGGLPEVLIAALGGGGVASALATSLGAYLSQPRRRSVRIRMKGPHGQEVEVDAQNASDAERLLQIALGRREDPQ
ncbi:hypothetical protein AB0K64_32545 [Streptomyces sp. NPDC053741]|uniref:effector-associated constant component EACC1 n=1 Tax=Streptomyces TaxID=1883 RepID=UPI0004C7FD6A|nr:MULTISPECIES: hypothetical protein [Streptomyces]MCY1649418.1 hypothetical protein [Streptomyces sp. SL203]WKV82114.1 hypothetical protein HBB06_30325 [Streptomyces sp. SNU607]WSZ45868.1 hypothetical protein OG337_00280 [[Kitasatospora] papulosa]